MPTIACKTLICKVQIFIIEYFSDFFLWSDARTQQIKEYKDRIRVYPSVALCSYKPQHKGDAMQCIV